MTTRSTGSILATACACPFFEEYDFQRLRCIPPRDRTRRWYLQLRMVNDTTPIPAVELLQTSVAETLNVTSQRVRVQLGRSAARRLLDAVLDAEATVIYGDASKASAAVLDDTVLRTRLAHVGVTAVSVTEIAITPSTTTPAPSDLLPDEGADDAPEMDEGAGDTTEMGGGTKNEEQSESILPVIGVTSGLLVVTFLSYFCYKFCMPRRTTQQQTQARNIKTGDIFLEIQPP